MVKLNSNDIDHLSLPSCYGATLGHGNVAPGLAHPFWGTERVMKALQKYSSYPRVQLTPQMIRREGATTPWGGEVSDICQ